MTPPRPRRPWLMPLLIGLLSFGLTVWLWNHERLTREQGLRTSFDASVLQAAGRIEQRLAGFEQMLRGAQGLFKAAPRVERTEFEAYVEALQSGADFAGLQALGFAAASPGARPAAPVQGIAPAIGSNLGLVGDDLCADAARCDALLRARDSGSLGVVPRPRRLPDGEAGFMMFLPLYTGGATPPSQASRRERLSGWVFALVRVGDLMSSLYGQGVPGIDLRVHDGVELAPATLIYASSTPQATTGTPHFRAHEYLGFADHTWTLEVATRPEFEQRASGDAALVILVAGTSLSALLAVLTWLLVNGRARAHDTATLMTRELRASEERYRRIVETTDEGIWLTDAAGITSFVNPKMMQLLGSSSEAVVGRPMAEFMEVGEGTGSAAASPMDEAAKHDGVRLRRADGEVLWASLATSPIVDAAGRPAGALTLVTDLTERKDAEATRALLEAQLRESQKMEAIGTLAGGIAHDFNNILAGILGHVALARQHLGAQHPARISLEQVGLAGVRARSLVQQILAFSRRQPHRPLPQALGVLVEESVRLLRPLLPARVELDLRLTEAPLTVAVDATQLQQVVMNLCTNAWHALDGGSGRISVALARVELDADDARRLGGLKPGPHAHLSVTDDGCGMDEATRTRVFEPFFTTKPIGQGTGLGLSVVHGIVASHGGAIGVASRPGSGTTFDLYFPAQAVSPEAAPPPHVETSAVPSSGGQHVLYVDDDPVMLVMVEQLLQDWGYRVASFERPAEALAALRSRPGEFDLVVTDFNMPGLSGMDVAREVGRLDPALPVVISSGYLSEEVRDAALRLGVRALVQKEFTLERLGGVVHEVLAGKVPAGPA